jgi:signal transduction histidine kinase
MGYLRGLRAQILLWTILPLIVVLMVIAFGSITLHQRSMRSMVARRDAELVEMAAARLNDALQERGRVLQSLLVNIPAAPAPQDALANSRSLLAPFDLGVSVYDAAAQRALATTGLSAGKASDLSPGQVKAILTAALSHPDQPVVALTAAADDQAAVLIGLVASETRQGAVGAVSAGALEIPALLQRLSSEGRRAVAFVVDPEGRVIFHSDPTQVGQDLRDHAGIREAARGRGGAVFARRPGQDEHVVAYARVTLAGWGLVVEEPWVDVVVPVLQYTLLAPLIVLAAAITSLAALYFGLQRVIRPLQGLGRQASRLAWGDFRAIGRPVDGIGEIQDLQRTLQEMAAQIQRRQAGMQDYIVALTRTQEDERKRLARELHDETVQSLVALVQRVKMLEYDWQACAGGQPTAGMLAAQGRLSEISAMLTQALHEVRALIRDLRPIYLEELGLVAALEMLAQTTQRDGPTTRFELSGEERRLAPEAELALYRIAQAAVSNAVRHGRPSDIRLQLEFADEGVILVAEDDGSGFVPPEMPGDLATQGHFGLVGMYERATALGGHLSIHSTPGQGTKVVAFIPYREPTAVDHSAR